MSEDELRLIYWVKHYGQDHTKVFVDDVSAVLTQLAAERQARQDAELLARAAMADKCRCQVLTWDKRDYLVFPPGENHRPAIPVTIGHNGLPQLTDALRAELRQALEGR